jgi:arginyl-tRNA synthetase
MIEQDIKAAVAHILTTQYSAAITADQVTINKTNKEHTGDFTVVVFPLARFTKLAPEAAGQAIGEALKTTCDFIAEFNVIKGFLNIVVGEA